MVESWGLPAVCTQHPQTCGADSFFCTGHCHPVSLYPPELPPAWNQPSDPSTSLAPDGGWDVRTGSVLATSPPPLPGRSPGEHCPRYSARVPLAARHTLSHGSRLPSPSAFELPSSESSRVSGSDSQNSLRSLQEGEAEPPGLG